MSAPSKIANERNQRALLELVAQPGNDACADCKTRNPRWASHSLGIFLCVNCASIHRKMGTHVSKVKSLTLDSWTKEQVEFMKQNGNVKSNAYYNPNEIRNPPPANIMDGERDSEMEKYIRSKYEYKRFIDKAAVVASKLRPSASSSNRTSPRPMSASPHVTNHAKPSPRATPPSSAPRPSLMHSSVAPAKSHLEAQASDYAPPLPPKPQRAQPQKQKQPSTSKPSGEIWDDLISLQGPVQSASLPLQFADPSSTSTSLGQQLQASGTPGPLPTGSEYPNTLTTPLNMQPSITGAAMSAPNLAFQHLQPQPLQPQPTLAFTPGNFGGTFAPAPLSAGNVSLASSANPHNSFQSSYFQTPSQQIPLQTQPAGQLFAPQPQHLQQEQASSLMGSTYAQPVQQPSPFLQPQPSPNSISQPSTPYILPPIMPYLQQAQQSQSMQQAQQTGLQGNMYGGWAPGPMSSGQQQHWGQM